MVEQSDEFESEGKPGCDRKKSRFGFHPTGKTLRRCGKNGHADVRSAAIWAE